MEKPMAQYVLSIYQPENGIPPPQGAREGDARRQRADSADQGRRRVGGLHPPGAATVVRLQSGELVMTDGPYIECQESIGGVIIIKVPDLDAAPEWARRTARIIALPREVRPVQGEA
jgi:hypothetical protein